MSTKEEKRRIPIPIVVGCIGLALLAIVCMLGVAWVTTLSGCVIDNNADFPTAKPICYGILVKSHLAPENRFIETERWDFQAMAGDHLIITMQTSDFESNLSLYKGKRTLTLDDLLVEDYDTGGVLGTNSQIEITIPEDGRYALVAGHWFESDGIISAGGAYTLTVEKQ